MRTTQGGTKKWCPYCKKTRVCAAVNPTELGKRSGQRWYKPKHDDVQWFRRGLICQSCDNRWLTAEIQETFLSELIQLREALGDLKKNAENYSSESSQAAASLNALTESLKVLKALDVNTDPD